MRKLLMILSVCCFVMTGMAAPVVLDVPVPDGDATPVLRRAIEQASSYKGRAVLIRLQQEITIFIVPPLLLTYIIYPIRLRRKRILTRQNI